MFKYNRFIELEVQRNMICTLCHSVAFNGINAMDLLAPIHVQCLELCGEDPEHLSHACKGQHWPRC